MGIVDKARAKAEVLRGQVKEAVGNAKDDPELTAEGKVDQTSGNLKQAGGSLKHAGEKLKDAFRK